MRPTVEEFVAWAHARHGCRVETCPFGPRTLRYLCHTDAQGVEHVLALPDSLRGRLTMTVIHSWCVQLNLPSDDFEIPPM